MRHLWHVLGAPILFLTIVACYDVVDPSRNGVVNLAMADTATADGASLTRVVATLEPLIADSLTHVTLSTTAGIFTVTGNSTATVIADKGGMALVYLRSPSDSTTAVVTAQSNAEMVTHTITFARAQPQWLSVSPAEFTVKSGYGNEVTFTATLHRNVGTPSPGIRLTFSASDTTAAHAPLGSFIVSGPSDSGGAVTARYSPGETDYRGRVIVTVNTLSVGMTPALSDTTSVLVVAP